MLGLVLTVWALVVTLVFNLTVLVTVLPKVVGIAFTNIYSELSCFWKELHSYNLDQWFSTWVPQNPWVPQKALGMPTISELDL